MTTAPLEYLVTRLHGRRSLMAEDERLLEFSRLTRVPDLARAVRADPGAREPAPLERQLQADLIRELQQLRIELPAPGDRLAAEMLARFQVANLQTVYRAWHGGWPEDSVAPHLLELPLERRIDPRALLRASSFPEFIRRLPERWRDAAESCAAAVADRPDRPPPFLFEATLDRAGLEGLLAAGRALPSREREVSDPVLNQEADLFHLQLAVRGHLLHQLSPETLLALHLPGTPLPLARFATLLRAPDLSSIAEQVKGRVIDRLPPPPQHKPEHSDSNPDLDLESLALQRLARLAGRAFRRSHLGLGAVVGYAALRRVEIANLTHLAEGIHDGIAHGELVESWWLNTRKEAARA